MLFMFQKLIYKYPFEYQIPAIIYAVRKLPTIKPRLLLVCVFVITLIKKKYFLL